MARGGQQQIPRPGSARPGEPNPWVDSFDSSKLTMARVEQIVRDLDGRHLPDDMPTTPMRPPFITTSRKSAVLVPLFEGDDGDLRVILTRRSGKLRNHKGEVSFPGGRIDEGETAMEAALREAHEEIRLPSENVRIVGQLESLFTVASNSAITPYVGLITAPLPELVPSPHEVERIFHVSLAELTHPECYSEEIWEFADGTFPVWFFEVEDDTIWGATARMLRRLLDLLLLSPS